MSPMNTPRQPPVEPTAEPIVEPTVLAEKLNTWVGVHGRDLLWRHPDTSAWGVLVSEVMAQQTPVRRVEPLWQAWMQHWPDPAALASAPTAEILRAWANLGYPRRALRLQECARACVEKHQGEVPTTISELEALPGVGSYTARAVAAFALGQAVPVVDTNVRRVYRRVVDGEFLQGPARSRDLRDVATLLPYVDPDPSLSRRQPGASQPIPQPSGNPAHRDAANLMCASLMELGALVCTAKNPSCEQCPISEHCRWVALGKPLPTQEAQDEAKRRVQKFAGTDRQVRGKIMAAVRGADVVSKADVTQLWADQVQLERCLESLVADGLVVVEVAAGNITIRLPH